MILGEHSDRSKGDYDTAGDQHYHAFSGTTEGASNRGTDQQLSALQNILPPYYALCFIMKL
jgi:hypothetical protein